MLGITDDPIPAGVMTQLMESGDPQQMEIALRRLGIAARVDTQHWLTRLWNIFAPQWAWGGGPTGRYVIQPEGTRREAPGAVEGVEQDFLNLDEELRRREMERRPEPPRK